MTVKEQVGCLQAMPRDIDVVIDSYEDHDNNSAPKLALKIFSKRRGEEVGYGE